MEVLRPYWVIRASGWWMMAVGLIGLVALTTVYAADPGGAWPALVAGIGFGVFAIGLGWRTAHISAEVEGPTLVVRNQFRTVRVPLGEIETLSVEKRSLGWGFGTRISGTLSTADRVVVIGAAESVRTPVGALMRRSVEHGRRVMEQLAEMTGVRLEDRTTG